MPSPPGLSFTHVGRPADIRFGVGAADPERIADALGDLGAGRVMIVASASTLDRQGPRLIEVLGDRVAARFTSVARHVPAAQAAAACAAARDGAADALLAIGGGSAVGTAKAVARELGLPIVAVPTTYAGSEVTPVWGMTENGRKQTGVDPRVLPRIVIYDPALTTDLPPALSVSSGLNALAHCLEAIWTPRTDPVAGLLGREGAVAIATGLTAIATDPAGLDGRTSALYGAWLAGSAFALAGSGLHHKVCHVLGGAYDLPHAELHAVVLPHATSVATQDDPARDRLIADALDADGDPAAVAVMALARRLGAPVSLGELGFDPGDRSRALSQLEEALRALPAPVSRPQLERLLDGAIAGELAR